MNAAITAMLQAGQSVIVDGQAFEHDINPDLEERLRELESAGRATIAIVELKVSDSALMDRHRRHQHPTGLALFHNTLPSQSSSPDLVIGTTSLDADQVADRLWDWLVPLYPALSTGPVN
ncbi:MAG: hypothetical protein ACR2P2_01725 [Nakamurella sp.]